MHRGPRVLSVEGAWCGSHRQPVWLQPGGSTEHPWLVRSRGGKAQGLRRQVRRVSASEQ